MDCPGHDILMATMLNGAAVMDAALLLIGQLLLVSCTPWIDVFVKTDIKGFKPEWCISTISCFRYTILVGNSRYTALVRTCAGGGPSSYLGIVGTKL